MQQKTTPFITVPEKKGASSSTLPATPFPKLLLLLLCVFIFVTLISVAPLNRLAGTTELATLPTTSFLLTFGALLPTDLHLSPITHASQTNTDSIEFLLLMAILFLLYICALLSLRKTVFNGYKKYLMLIWIGAILVGIIYVLTPSLLSRDAFVYAGYGRVIVAHSANPYYTPLSAFPHDPLLAADDWRNALAAYGPLWLLVCAISTLLSGSAMLPYLFFFRILGLAAYLANIWLVSTILKKWGFSNRVVLIGTLFYAWNPLVLLESNLGAHNDTVMVTCLLSGILLTLRAEQDAFTRPIRFLMPVVAFSAAILIKFTAAPLLAFYIVLLVVRTLKMHQQAWQAKLFRDIGAFLLAALLIFIAYIPLWLGHSLKDILTSQASPPSSRLAFGSILLALQKVSLQQHQADTLLTLFSKHSVWNIIDLLVMLSLFIVGVIWLWRVPTTRTMLMISLASLIALLIVTPWFFPWYVVWLIGLAALLISSSTTHIEKALVVSTLTFSASALFIYLFRGYPPIGDWSGVNCLTTTGPPLLVFLIFMSISPLRRRELYT